MWKIAEICLISVIFIQSSHAYSMGAPDQACKKMQPGLEMPPVSILLFCTHLLSCRSWIRSTKHWTRSSGCSSEADTESIARIQHFPRTKSPSRIGRCLTWWIIQGIHCSSQRRFWQGDSGIAISDPDPDPMLQCPCFQIGNFEIEEDTSSHMTCGKGIHNSITHRNSEDKKAVKATWTAPSDFEGEVYFR